MEMIVAVILNAVAGMAGGGAVGALIKTAGMAILPKLIAGAIGGIAGGTAIGAILGDPAATADAATAATSGAIDWGALIAQLAGGAAGGGVLTGIAAQVFRAKA